MGRYSIAYSQQDAELTLVVRKGRLVDATGGGRVHTGPDRPCGNSRPAAGPCVESENPGVDPVAAVDAGDPLDSLALYDSTSLWRRQTRAMAWPPHGWAEWPRSWATGRGLARKSRSRRCVLAHRKAVKTFLGGSRWGAAFPSTNHHVIASFAWRWHFVSDRFLLVPLVFVWLLINFSSSNGVPFPLEKVFLFFANPRNLPRIMPPATATRLTGLKLTPPPGAPVDSEALAGVGSQIVDFVSRVAVSFRARAVGRRDHRVRMESSLRRRAAAWPVQVFPSPARVGG